MNNEVNEQKKLANENELLLRRVQELEFALDATQKNLVPRIIPSKKLNVGLVAFMRMAFFPLAGGLVRVIYKGFYRKK